MKCAAMRYRCDGNDRGRVNAVTDVAIREKNHGNVS